MVSEAKTLVKERAYRSKGQSEGLSPVGGRPLGVMGLLDYFFSPSTALDTLTLMDLGLASSRLGMDRVSTPFS